MSKKTSLRVLIVLASVALAIGLIHGTANVPVEGYKVVGDISAEDVQAIESLIPALTTEPILHMHVVAPARVEVMTGIVRGPLDGGGDIFEFEKRDGEWIQVNKDSVRFWVS